MTQSPQSGQTAPRTTDFGSVSAARHAPADTGARWGSTSTAPGQAPADAPTGSMPFVPSTNSRSADTSTASTPRSARQTRARGPRRARLQLRHINPWTVLKFSCVLSIALFFVWLIVVGVLFGILDGAGIIQKINDTVTTINGAGSQPPVTAGIVFGAAAIIGVVNIVLFIALSTVGSVVYNLCADLVGGIEVTLSER
ncbi:MAG TPA: DUF3566 domain-containing protein [Jatrophihabitans sp.]|jgi:hypothetical protein|uniref:DUF3566 domain-containing protein n=1 Tax=Jatrophihabitans sp. TaxID=1932789 RepID=UPI002E09D3F3|nr:DUF3566 domain-containing protein [Jatrophihabitans sp.]